MQEISISEAIEITSGTLKYQYYTTAILGLCQFTFSIYILGLPYMLSQNTDLSISSDFLNFSNDQKYLKEIIIDVYFIGITLGSILFSWLADKYGRKKVLKIATLFYSLFSFIISIALSINVLVICSFFLGFFFQNVLSITFIILTEVLPINSRVVLSSLLMSCWSLGLIYNSLMYLYEVSWRYNLMIISFMLLLCYKLFDFIYESPRNLLLCNNPEKALKVLNKISICNGKGPFTHNIIDLDITPNTKNASQSSYLALFNKNLIITTLILFVYWFNTILIYYGLIFTSVAIVSNPYINGIIIAFMEIISMIFTSLFGNRFKRKNVVFLSMLIARSGLYLISAFSYFSPDSAIVIIPFAIAKLGLSFEFYYLYLCTGELYPTYCRSVAFGLCGIVGRFGGVAQARIVSFANDYEIQPTLIIAAVGCLSFISVCVMRETANDEFKEVDEGEGKKGG